MEMTANANPVQSRMCFKVPSSKESSAQAYIKFGGVSGVWCATHVGF